MGRLKNRLLASLYTRFPKIFNLEKFAERAVELGVDGIPWAPLKKPLSESSVAIVTTAGVHLKDQKPFDMLDRFGDPSFRVLPTDTPRTEYTITHDYYDHTDADRDINIVFPIERLEELKSEGVIGALAPNNYGFMGHIDGPYIRSLIGGTAPDVARRLRDDGADVVIFTPG